MVVMVKVRVMVSGNGEGDVESEMNVIWRFEELLNAYIPPILCTVPACAVRPFCSLLTVHSYHALADVAPHVGESILRQGNSSSSAAPQWVRVSRVQRSVGRWIRRNVSLDRRGSLRAGCRADVRAGAADGEDRRARACVAADLESGTRPVVVW